MFRRTVKALLPRQLFKKIEPYGHLLETVLANIRYGFPARGLKVIGVTGTDGKTTTTTLIWTMLKEAGYNVGYMTTIGYGTPKQQISNHVHMTSMQAFPLMRRIKEMRSQGIEWLVLETTSHALAQHRVWGVPYSLAVMTNVNHEHLDYHGTFEHYRDAKRKLFKIANANKDGLRVGIINAEDASAELFASDVARPLTYGIKDGDIRATEIVASAAGTSYILKYRGQKLHITMNIPGDFNIYNSMAAAGVGLAMELTPVQIEQGIAALKTVEGRMTNVEKGQDFSVIVDFAHTPASFEKLLSDMDAKTKPPKRLIVMFGSAGRRDESKRAIQGGIAGKYADIVIVTEEDDRDIDGIGIMEQIAAGATGSGKTRDQDLFLIHDRVEAINYAIGLAKKGDVVMMLGKGHEKTIERADGEHEWNEVAEVEKAIKAKA